MASTALKNVDALAEHIQRQREVFMSALTEPRLKFEAEAGFAMEILTNPKNDYALGCARNYPDSVSNAVRNVAAIGLSLNPALKHAYLVPRDGRICLDIGYLGLIELAVASGSILWAQAQVVHQSDIFKRLGIDKAPQHEFDDFADDRGDLRGVYCVAKTHSGDYLTHAMKIGKVYAIRDRSDAWKSFVAKKIKSCPWSTDPEEMIKKTCAKQGSKWWPKTERLDHAIHYLNTEGGEGIDHDDTPPSADWTDPKPLHEALKATTTDESALDLWRSKNALLKDQPDDHAKFKDAVIAHRNALAAKQGAPA